MSHGPERFNAIYAVPNTLSGRYIPLVVDIHGGPHDMSTTSFQHRAKVFLKLGFAVLMINYRGSIGNGDRTLQSILGNVAKVFYPNIPRENDYFYWWCSQSLIFCLVVQCH